MENREENNARHRGKYKERAEYHREYQKKYREEHGKEVRDYIKKYKKEHPEKRREQKKAEKHKRAARIKKLQSTLTVAQWNKIKEHFDGRCAYCGKTGELQQDHFVPLAKNGEYTHNNIVPACARCNGSKSDNSFFEWYFKQVFYSELREKKILKFLGYKGEVQQLKMMV